MTTLKMPTEPGFSSASFGLVAATQVFQSPLSGQTQTLDLGWEFWQASYVLKPMKAAQAGPWRAFLAQLRGRAGRFEGYDPMSRCACGVLGTSLKPIPADGNELYPAEDLYPSESLYPGGTENPGFTYPDSISLTLIGGVSRGDSSVCVSGVGVGYDWSSGVYPGYAGGETLICAGGYIQVGDELKMLTDGIRASSCGGACVSFVPPMRSDVAAGSAVKTDDAAAIMRLVDDGQAQWSESPGGIYSISFSAVEAI